MRKKNLENDEKRLCYPNRKLKHEESAKNGHLEGEAIFYSDEGIVLSKVFYRKDQPEGEAAFYYRNGAPYSIQHFKNGVWDGLQQFFHPDGSLQNALNYKEGKICAD